MNLYKSEAARLKWAIKKYGKTKTDKWIARGLTVPVDRVKKCRQRLGIKKLGFRHKAMSAESVKT